MRVLQVLWDGGGNSGPQLSIGRTLVERGHRVEVLGNRSQRKRVEAIGASFREFRHAPDADSSSAAADLIRDWEARTPIGAFGRVRDRVMFGPSLLFARDVLESLEESPADVVAWDYMLQGAGMGAERAGVLSAALIHTVYPLPVDGVPPFGLGLMPARGVPGRMRDALLRRVSEYSLKPGLKAANRARTALGLDLIDEPFDQVSNADRVLVLTSPAFDFPSEDIMPANVRFTGPVLDATSSASWDSPWDNDDSRPLVLASFSTTFMDQGDMAKRTIHALGDLPVRGLLTTGPAVDPAALPRASNVEVSDFVPHAAVLPHAALAITHAGAGTVHAALAAGVPLVCMPDGRDQSDMAARVVACGAGVRTSRGSSSRKLRRLIKKVLDDPSYASAANRMASAFGVQDGATQAADQIESLVG